MPGQLKSTGLEITNRLESEEIVGFVLFESIVAAAFPRLSLLPLVGRFNLDKLDFLERFAFKTPLSENTNIAVALCWMLMMKRSSDCIKPCQLCVQHFMCGRHSLGHGFDLALAVSNHVCLRLFLTKLYLLQTNNHIIRRIMCSDHKRNSKLFQFSGDGKIVSRSIGLELSQ